MKRYEQPVHLPGKGETLCNREACQCELTAGFRWWNKGTEHWYCQPCAWRINTAGTDRDGTPLCVREDELPGGANDPAVAPKGG